MEQLALNEGARGYLSKVLTGPEIVRVLQRVMRGETGSRSPVG